MARRKGLGRGLAELLGDGQNAAWVGDDRRDEAPKEEVPAIAGSGGERTAEAFAGRAGVRELPVTAIRPNPRQPRRGIDEGPLAELARSIESVGLIQPVIVRRSPTGREYELIAGERRWRAAQIAGYTVIPAIVREASDVESLELALVENVVRQDLNVVDEAYALQVLLDDLGVTQDALAAQVGKSRSAIANKIRLLELPAPVQEFLIDGTLTEGHGRALLGLRSRGDRLRLARKAAKGGLSVRAVEAEVRRMNDPAAMGRGRSPEPRLPEEMLDEIRDRFFGRFEVVPRVRGGAAGGAIELPFRDEDHLRKLLALLDG